MKLTRADGWFQHTYWKMYDDLRVAADRSTVSAVKAVTWNEPLLRTDGQGHVVLPECFVVEGFLQMVAMMFQVTDADTVRAAMLLKVKSATFLRTPRLGDRLLYEARIRSRSGTTLIVDAAARLAADGSLVAEAELLESLLLKSSDHAVALGRVLG